MKLWVLSVHVHSDDGTGVIGLYKESDKSKALDKLEELYKEEAKEDNFLGGDLARIFTEDLTQLGDGNYSCDYGDVCTWTLELLEVED
jgi:hypothetical protein